MLITGTAGLNGLKRCFLLKLGRNFLGSFEHSAVTFKSEAGLFCTTNIFSMIKERRFVMGVGLLPCDRRRRYISKDRFYLFRYTLILLPNEFYLAFSFELQAANNVIISVFCKL